MAKKNHEEEHEKDNAERWLLTYADLITLLLALFIIMYAMSSIDSDKYASMANSMRDAFNVMNSAGSGKTGVMPESSKEIGISNQNKSTDKQGEKATPKETPNATSVPVPTSVPTSQPTSAPTATPTGNDSLNKVYQDMVAYIQQKHVDDKISVINGNTELKITLKDTILFKANSAKMNESSGKVLKTIERSIANVYPRISHITISGHTADPSNYNDYSSDFDWDLSVNRAVAVLKYLKNQGLREDKMSIEGYSHFAPVGDNNSEEGRMKNRRVEITIKK